jgi:hypothetical protein
MIYGEEYIKKAITFKFIIQLLPDLHSLKQ